MKKTIVALMALAGVATAGEVTWTGEGADSKWGTADNWSTNTVPTNGDTIIINDGSSVTWDGVAAGVKYDDSTIWEVTNGSTLTLGTKAANSGWAHENPRFDGSFYIDETSSVTTTATYFKGTSTILGTLYTNNYVSSADGGCTLNFGLTGQIVYNNDSANGMEGNGRTITLGAILDTGVDGEIVTYSLVKRYLIAGDSGNDFRTNMWGDFIMVGGNITGTEGVELLASSAELNAVAEDFGKYYLAQDTGGIYMSYVKASAVPEPTTATLSLLALAGLAARRRRK